MAPIRAGSSSCVAPPGALEAAGLPAGETAIAILPEHGSAAPRLSTGAPTDDPPSTRRHRVDW
jgi:hypothetical protein